MDTEESWPRLLGSVDVAAYSLSKSDAPLEAGTPISLELSRGGHGPLRFSSAVEGHTIGNVDMGSARWLQPLLAENKITMKVS